MILRRVLAIAALLAAPAAALAKPVPLLQGIYRFTTTDRDSKTGRPVCTERWIFTPGQKMAVESGDERVAKTFRIIKNRTGTLLVTRTLSTNFQPDCTGQASTGTSQEEQRTYLLPMNGSDVMTCPPPGKTAKGIPLIANCFGTLRRIASSAGMP